MSRISKLIVTFLLSLNVINIQGQMISAFDRGIIEQRILEKVNDFFSYLPEIAGKGNGSKEERALGNRYLDRTLNLFLGEGSTFGYLDENGHKRKGVVKISISSGGQIKTLSLKKYLTKLLKSPYDRISFNKCTAIRIDEEPVVVDSIQYLAIASVVLIQSDSINNSLYINDDGAKKIKVYVQRKVVLTPDGEDVFWIAKLGDINIKDEKE